MCELCDNRYEESSRIIVAVLDANKSHRLMMPERTPSQRVSDVANWMLSSHTGTR